MTPERLEKIKTMASENDSVTSPIVFELAEEVSQLNLQVDAMRKALEKIRDHEGPGLDGSPPTILYDVAVSALSVGLEKRNPEIALEAHVTQGDIKSLEATSKNIPDPVVEKDEDL